MSGIVGRYDHRPVTRGDRFDCHRRQKSAMARYAYVGTAGRDGPLTPAEGDDADEDEQHRGRGVPDAGALTMPSVLNATGRRVKPALRHLPFSAIATTNMATYGETRISAFPPPAISPAACAAPPAVAARRCRASEGTRTAPVPERRRARRYLTLKNAGLADIVLVIVFILLSLWPGFRPHSGASGNLIQSGVPSSDPPPPRHDPTIVDEGPIDGQPGADSLLLDPAAQDQLQAAAMGSAAQAASTAVEQRNFEHRTSQLGKGQRFREEAKALRFTLSRCPHPHIQCHRHHRCGDSILHD